MDRGHQHPLQLGFILGGHHGEIGDGAEIADVVLALVGGAICPDNASPIQNKGDRQILDAHVVDQLVKGPLQEGAVDRHHGLETLTGHAGCHGDGVLFGDANVEILIGQGLLEQVEAGAGGHGGGNAHHCRVLLTELDQGLAKYLAVARRFRFAGGVSLAGCQVEGTLGVVANLIGLRIGVTLALSGGHMHQHGPFSAMGLLKGAHHPGDVMAIDRADVGEAQLLEHGSHLGNR